MDPCKTSNHSYDTIPGLWSGVRNVMVGCSQCDTPPLAEPSRYSYLPKAALIPDSIRTGAPSWFSMAEYLGLAGSIVGPGLVRRRRLRPQEHGPNRRGVRNPGSAIGLSSRTWYEWTPTGRSGMWRTRPIG